MLKMNKTSKLFNYLALMTVLTLSTTVYAMEPEEESPKVARSKSPNVIDPELMEEVRYIVQGKVLQNLYSSSKKHFATNEYMEYKSLDKARGFPQQIDEVQHIRNIFWFNQNILTQPGFAKTLNNDIISLLKFGTKPTYFECADAFDGVAEVLSAKGITLDSLMGRENASDTTTETPAKKTSEKANLPAASRENAFANSSEASESEASESETSEKIITAKDTLKGKKHRKHRHCNLQ